MWKVQHGGCRATELNSRRERSSWQITLFEWVHEDAISILSETAPRQEARATSTILGKPSYMQYGNATSSNSQRHELSSLKAIVLSCYM